MKKRLVVVHLGFSKIDKVAKNNLQSLKNSNSNCTFIALNLYLLTDSKTHKVKNQRS